jgi:uncharacterized membrane protein
VTNAIAGPSLFIGGEILLIALMFHFLPQLTRADIFFAVTVDPAYRRTSEAQQVLRLFRTVIWLTSALALAMVVLGVILELVFLVLLAIFWQIAAAFAAFLVARKQVLPHAALATATREAALVPRSAGVTYWLLQIGPFLILAAHAAYLNANWERIPERFPVHWGLNGEPNGWSTRSFSGVYGPLLIAAAICALLVLSSYAIVHWTRNIRSSGDAGANESRFRRVQLGIMTAVAYFIALVFAGVASPLRANPQGEPHITLLLAATFVFIAAVFMVMFHVGQGGTNLNRSADRSAAATLVIGDRTPDQCWKAGVFYVNPDDPALFVERRFGIGYTINFGHRGAWVIIGALVAIILLPVLIATMYVHPH